MKLSDFNILKSFTSKSGECYIVTSKLDGKKYFIKRNVEITYGSDSDTIERKKEYKKNADEWMNYHNSVKNEFLKHWTGNGNIIFPTAYFVDEGKVYEIQHYVDIKKIPISDADKDKKHPNEKKVCDLDPTTKIMLLRTSSFALKQIHECGLIHFDLKPDNVPICQSEMGGYISKITDCGDAAFANNIPRDEWIVCTDPYWSPELAYYKIGTNEQKASAKPRLSSKNDVFAMGLIFHEWWTGDFPYYDGRDDFVNLYQVVYNSWPNKIKIDSSVPLWLKSLILDMLYPEPEKRPSMDTVFEAIKNQNYISTLIPPPPPEPKLSFDKLKQLIISLPKGDEISKYTDDSYTNLKETVAGIKANFNKLQTQEQVDKVTARLKEAVNALTLKPQNNKFKKIEDAIATIESKNLSRYTPESRDNLLKLVNFAKRQKGELTDENNINRLYSAIVNAYKALSIRSDFSIEVISPLPAPYTKVEILSDDYVMAYYGENGKIKLLSDNAIKMKLIRRK